MSAYRNVSTRKPDTGIRVEKYGFRWREDFDCGVPHEPGNCDACDRGDVPECCEAFVLVSRPINENGTERRLQEFTSAGLFGICGADDSYRREVEREEWADLCVHCAAFGVTLPEQQ